MWQLVVDDDPYCQPCTVAVSTSKKVLEAYLQSERMRDFREAQRNPRIVKLVWNGTVYVPKEENE